jgi:Heterokaryon incompatibility protein (HET)
VWVSGEDDPNGAISASMAASGLSVTSPGIRLRICEAHPTCSVRITENLRNALLHLRKERDFRTLWSTLFASIKNGIQGRGSQVQIMASIFAAAARILIWLGMEDGNTVAALKLARRLIEWEKVAPDIPCILGRDGRRDPIQPWDLDQNHPCYFSEGDWFAFLKLLNRDWFERAWTFQEAVYANECLIRLRNRVIE